MDRKPLRFVVTADCIKAGPKKGGGQWRQQGILVHQGEEVRRIGWFLKDDDKPMDHGEYRLAPDAVFVGEVTRVDRKTGEIKSELGLRIALRSESFVKVPAVTAAPARAA